MRWEYLSVIISYDKKRKNWFVGGRDGDGPGGVQHILNAYGAQGWELVGLAADQSVAYPAFGKWSIESEFYRATFKRPGNAE